MITCCVQRWLGLFPDITSLVCKTHTSHSNLIHIEIKNRIPISCFMYKKRSSIHHWLVIHEKQQVSNALVATRLSLPPPKKLHVENRAEDSTPYSPTQAFYLLRFYGL